MPVFNQNLVLHIILNLYKMNEYFFTTNITLIKEVIFMREKIMIPEMLVLAGDARAVQ